MVKKPLRNVAYNYLYDSIITNKLSPGQAIVEQEISDLLGVSRTPIREALKQLTAERLVRHIPARGTFVEEMSTQDVEELFEIRMIFEETALKWAIDKITDGELDEMERALNSLNDDVAQPEDFYCIDRKLHDLILRYGRNRRMIEFLDNVNSQLERLRRISAMTPKRLEKSKIEHLEILCAIKERNLEKAVGALHSHLKNVEKSTLDVCEQARLKITKL
jgi:DNA-binding GntR family transcriptional regulator